MSRLFFHAHPRRPAVFLALVFAGMILAGCGAERAGETPPVVETAAHEPSGEVLRAGFLAVETVFNSELMAPYDVLQHTRFRDPDNYIETFIVSPDGQPFTTFEGITITPHYSFDDAPPIDILVIPSTGNSMTADLENERLMAWLKKTVAGAKWVVTVCDGAFPLAATGALDGRIATTFPGDRDRFAEMFPEIDVRYDVRFVQDGKFITSVGGGMSYEPAFYLVERLYGKEHAARTAGGLVWPWDLDAVPHLIVHAE
jgi:transcriptional regulator GlxA family with amidase domain